MRILFVSANPTSTKKLELADELRRFQHSLSGHNAKLMLLPAAQPEDLEIAIESRAVDVVHFSGHADERGILMRNSKGVEVVVPKEELRGLFKDKGIKLVVLNACKTLATADELTDSVDTVISTSDLLDDRVARMLTTIFYSAIGRGESLEDAYTEAFGKIAKRFPKENVYIDPQDQDHRGHGLDNGETLLPKEKPGEGQLEFEAKDPFDRYFYVDYLNKQIRSYRLNRRVNLAFLIIMLGVGLSFLVAMWNGDMEAAKAAAGATGGNSDACLETQGFFSWNWCEFKQLVTASRGETPLLDWLAKVGAAIPMFVATMQARWCVHGAEKIRQLEALKELVRNSENLTDDLRTRLHKIFEQSLNGAEEPKLLANLLPSQYRKIRSALDKMSQKIKRPKK